jgi:hypothetical protein
VSFKVYCVAFFKKGCWFILENSLGTEHLTIICDDKTISNVKKLSQ